MSVVPLRYPGEHICSENYFSLRLDDAVLPSFPNNVLLYLMTVPFVLWCSISLMFI